MDLQTIKNMVSSEEYNFLRNNDHQDRNYYIIRIYSFQRKRHRLSAGMLRLSLEDLIIKLQGL